MEKIDVVFESWEKYLHWIINLCEDPQAPFVIFLPWISWKALTQRFDYLAQAFIDWWLNFFRFNFGGYEEWCDINSSSLDSELNDLKSAVNYLALMGYNMVNYGILAKSLWWMKAFLNEDERMKCVWLLAPATFFDDNWNIDVMRTMEYWFIESVKNFIIDTKKLEDFHISTILIHWDTDDIVDIENSKKIYELLKWKKQFHKIPWANHSMERPLDKEKVLELCVPFFKENLSF